MRSLLAQQDVDFELIIVDDRSSDARRAILVRLAAEAPRLRVAFGKPLPEGWVDKPWALHQARDAWLLFPDADSAQASRIDGIDRLSYGVRDTCALAPMRVEVKR